MKRINGCGSQTVYPFIRYASVDADVENITSPAPAPSASPRERHQRVGEEAVGWRLKSLQQKREACLRRLSDDTLTQCRAR